MIYFNQPENVSAMSMKSDERIYRVLRVKLPGNEAGGKCNPSTPE